MESYWNSTIDNPYICSNMTLTQFIFGGDNLSQVGMIMVCSALSLFFMSNIVLMCSKK